MTETLATIRGTAQRLNEMVRQTAANYHEDVYLRVLDDRVEVLMQTNGRQVVSYCTFNEDHFKEIDGEAEAILPVGGKGADSNGFLDYMAFAESEGTVEITFLGDEDAELAERWRAEGALNTELRLPTSDDDYAQIPFDHPPRWTPDNQYASKACLTDDGTLPEDEDEWVTGSVVIETDAEIIKTQIIEPADFADGVNYYPLVVEDGEFVVRVEGSQRDDSIWGVVNAEKVEGPDVEREFAQSGKDAKGGFKEVIGTLDGSVRLQTAPGGSGDVEPPVTVVQDHRDDRTIRHLIGALAERD